MPKIPLIAAPYALLLLGSAAYAQAGGVGQAAPSQATQAPQVAADVRKDEADTKTPEERAASEKARTYFREAAALHKTGDYRGAIALLTKAYGSKPAPVLLYNIADCYWKLFEFQPALDYYQRYLRAAGDPKNEKAVRRRIAELEAVLAASRHQPVQTPTEKKAAQVVDPKANSNLAPEVVQPTVDHAPQTPTPRPTDSQPQGTEPLHDEPSPTDNKASEPSAARRKPTQRLRNVAVAAGSVGVASLAGSLAAGYAATTAGERASRATTFSARDDRNGQQLQTLHYALLGLSAVGIATATLLLLLNETGSDDDISTALLPVITANTATLHAHKRF